MYFRSGGEVPHIGRYGGLSWRILVQGMNARAVIPLSTEFG